MNAASIPNPRASGRQALAAYQVLDTPAERCFDDLTRLTASLCETPVALIAFADGDRIWFKSRVGLDRTETDATRWFCSVTMEHTEVLVVENASADARFREHPLVAGDPRLRFYAGAPLRTPDGLPIGTLCVLDRKPRRLLPQQATALETLSRQVITELERRRLAAELKRSQGESEQALQSLFQAQEKYRGLFENVIEGIFQTTAEGNYIAANPMLARIYGYESAEDLFAAISDIEHQLYVDPARRDEFTRLLQEQDSITDFESQVYRKDKSIIWISENARAVRDADGNLLYYQGTVQDITQHKEAEETLRFSELRFRSIWQNSAEGMRLTDQDGITRAVNPAFCRIIGMPAPEIEGRPFTVVYAEEEDPQDRLVRFKDAFRDRTMESLQERHLILRSGRQIDVEISNSFLELDGRDPMVLSIFHDVTKRKQMEQALRDSEVLYHSLVENLPQHIFRKDVQGRITFGNKRYCDELKMPLEQALGKTDFDLFPPELATKYRHDDRRVMELGETLDTVEEHQTPDGQKIYVHVIKTPLRDAGGNVIGVQGMFWDVTAQKLTEQQLAFERDLLRALLDNAPDRIYFKDRHSRFLKCSLALAERLGLPDPETVVGRSDFEFHPHEVAQEFFNDEQNIIDTGQPLVNKVERQIDLDGLPIWASVTKVPIRNRLGKVTGIIGISRDITALKHAEEALARARDQALETARLKSEFLAIMSHEIRTPMNGIIGMTGLLLETNLNPEQRDFTETVRESANALLDIINDILDFSKIEAGKMVFESVDFDLRDVIESMVDLLAERAQFKGLELVLQIMDDVPTGLRGDPGRLRQILLNLTGNAIKFTERGEVLVRAEKEEETETHVRLRLSVIDTGIGIAAEARDRMFEPFTQADSSTTRKYGGTGLGLAICKQLVEMRDGHIDVESEPGKGSKFSFTLLLEKQDRDTTAPGREEIEMAGRQILIVDDNATNRQMLEHQAAAWKMDVLSAADGTAALEILRREHAAKRPVELALIDMQMPGMDGLTLAKTIKTDPDLAATHLVMLSSLGHRFDSATLSAAGIACCLLKPAKQSRLFDGLVLALTGEETTLFHRGDPGARSSASAAKHTVRILLAEDNSVNLKVALLQLQKLGYKADTVANGEEVLLALRRIPYEIVLMDCHMPVMDGYEAARQIRRREEEARHEPHPRPPVHIIAMTANALDGDREQCLAAGMNDYVAKPTQLEELDVALRRALKPAPAAEPPSPASPDAVAHIDLGVIDGLRELREPGEPDPVAELIDLFLSVTPPQLQKLSEAVSAGDAARLRAVSHSLKGSASNLGARQLAALCATLEENARNQELSSAAQLAGQIQQEYQQVEVQLTAEKSR